MDTLVTRESVDRELRRRKLAQRLVAHQARTKTIFRLTGLSRHQLATLRKRWCVTREMRRRGPAPTSYAVLRLTLRVRSETAALAVFWRAICTAHGTNPKKISAVELGEHICDVFETYQACFPKTQLELEHLMLLAQGLEQGDSIALSACAGCEALIVIDLLTTRRHLCTHCQQETEAPAVAQPAVNGGRESEGPTDRSSEAVQQELF